MKPKSKFQQQVFELSKTLPALTETQVQWAYQNCLPHIAKRTVKGVISCLECGHIWQDKSLADKGQKHCLCPHCQARLDFDDTLQRAFKQKEYLCVVAACKGFQVLRFFWVQAYSTAGNKTQRFISEVVQRWIAPNGKYITLARLRIMNFYADTWNFDSNLEIRPEKYIYNISPTCIFPRQRLIPELKRSGYRQTIDGVTPFDLFCALLTDSRAETLLKAGQTNLLAFFAGKNFKEIDNCWSSVKICIRNNHTVKDASIWCDYIDLLRFFSKDLHNAKYVCPADLKAEHDRYVKKKREWQEQEHRAENRKKALKQEENFRQLKSKFFGITFTDGEIEVHTLDSVEEIMREGDIMHHCVFASEYHLKPDSLIFSACVAGEKMETVEFSLSKMQVVQSRGVCNKNTEYHDRIIDLVAKNRRLIQMRMAA